MDKSPDAFRTISEAAEDLGLPQHGARFWETRFPQIKPLKRGGGRRYYRPDDVELLRVIKQLLYGEGYTIKGVQKLIKEQGARALASSASADGGDHPPRGAFDGQGRDDERPAAAREQTAPAQPARQEAPRPALSAPDMQALKSALAEIVEGERILSLARAS